MAQKKTKTKPKPRKASSGPSVWQRVGNAIAGQAGRIGRGASAAALTMLVLGGLLFGMSRLEAQVARRVDARFDQAEVALVDLPASLVRLAEPDLRAELEPLLDRPWTAQEMCPLLAAALLRTGWADEVRYVRRGGDGVIRISARYRVPFALVQEGMQFCLVDGAGVRLPGVYQYDPSWLLVQGAGAPAPHPGQPWPGEDLQAGLSLIRLLQPEPFRPQIVAVLVDNYAGRRDAHASHLELATDHSAGGGRIRWGSALGQEVEENSPAQKLALLRENYRRHGRADAGHRVIDVSVYPDRITIPG